MFTIKYFRHNGSKLSLICSHLLYNRQRSSLSIVLNSPNGCDNINLPNKLNILRKCSSPHRDTIPIFATHFLNLAKTQIREVGMMSYALFLFQLVWRQSELRFSCVNFGWRIFYFYGKKVLLWKKKF